MYRIRSLEKSPSTTFYGQEHSIAKGKRGTLKHLGVISTLLWRHNGRDGVPNHQPHHCLLNRLFRRHQRKYQSSASLASVRSPVNSPHKGPVTRKMFPFDDVIMNIQTPSHQYRDTYYNEHYHYEDKTVVRLSYFYNGNAHTWKDRFYIDMGPWFHRWGKCVI